MMGRLKLLDDSREEFVSNVSHELKTPMTSMKVLADSSAGAGKCSGRDVSGVHGRYSKRNRP